MAVIVDIDHEDGTLDAYDSIVTDGGDLSVDAAAGLAATGFGLQCVIDDTTALQAIVNISLTTEVHYRCRFYFDPNGLTMANNDAFNMLDLRADGGSKFGTTQLIKTGGGVLQVQQRFKDDAGEVGTFQFTITDAPHFIEVHIEKASTDVASDGRVRVWVDGNLEHTESNLDMFDAWTLHDFLWIGAVAAVDAGTSGTLFLDQLVVNTDGSEIGPHVSMIGPQMMMGVGT